MAVQETFWVAVDGMQFKTQAEAQAWELRKSAVALAQAVSAISVDGKGNLDSVAINGLVSTFATVATAIAVNQGVSSA